MATLRRRHLIVTIAASALVFSLLGVIGQIHSVIVRSVNKDPFRMTLTPNGTRTVVQFAQPGKYLLSEEFTVDLSVAASQTIDLRSSTIPIPGVAIDFHDTTILPGRFTVQIGGTEFDVMDRVVIVNGKEHHWRSAAR